MKLTDEEKAMLDGARGGAVRKSMEILTALGELYGAERLLAIESAQISGVSFDNLGDAGLAFLEQMARDGRARVRATLNPAGMDTEAWREFGIPEAFARKQRLVLEAFRQMGAEITCSCTPYCVGNLPQPGDHVAWGESSAVTFANSVLGARTNKEGGPSSLAAALTGRTPAYGLHLDANRRPEVLVQVEAEPATAAGMGALGKVLGERLGGRIPWILGVRTRDWDLLKALSASIVTFGGAPLFHVEGVTPERHAPPSDFVSVTRRDVAEAVESLNDGPEDVDFVFLGCPHLSLAEMERIARLLEGRRVTRELWLGVARPVRRLADERGYTRGIEAAGARIACDTCHVVASLKGRFRTLATNSAKGVFYGRGKNGFRTVFGEIEACIDLATREGKAGKDTRGRPSQSAGAACDPATTSARVGGGAATLSRTSTRETGGPAHPERVAEEGSLDTSPPVENLPGYGEGDARETEAMRADPVPAAGGTHRRVIEGRAIFAGAADGAALVSSEPLSFYGGVDVDTGVVTERGHPLEGQSVKDRVLVFPHGKGSTVGSYTLYRMKRNGVAPKAILTRDCDTVTAVGAIISEIPCVDGIDVGGIDPDSRVVVGGNTLVLG